MRRTIGKTLDSVSIRLRFGRFALPARLSVEHPLGMLDRLLGQSRDEAAFGEVRDVGVV